MGDQLPSVGGVGAELTLAEIDVIADRERSRAELAAKRGGLFVGMDPHRAELGTETRLHETAHVARQGRATGRAALQAGHDVRRRHRRSGFLAIDL
ncbi:MAG TPA: hypothetical protein VK337_19560 [Xanthobacteraceae bacterium]|nr:hypothetical protein [Xanthobacteraceae bacterium]